MLLKIISITTGGLLEMKEKDNTLNINFLNKFVIKV